ncbi:hypothetical protein U9M48_002672 [Paspalum notatum var. saurae]|uniref:DDE Tnp4 domain-containing protein n=1 Tax=Paspalum notatum var. saurae TaxID=547442 RepID=A0AAQ3PGB1_PASNO
MLPRDMERIAKLRFIYESDDTHCVNLLRMKRAPFFQLCDLFRARLLLRDSIHNTIEEQAAMFLHAVGHNQSFRVIGLTFRRSIETISRYFQKVLYAVGELRNEMIVPPATSVHPRIQNSRRWYPYFKDCLGAIDGTHVLARVPVKMQPAFIGRKHTTTQNVLAAVDFDLRFTYCHRCSLFHCLDKFYLVDVGYAVRPGFLPPYRGTRYHLRELGNNRPRDQRELFNLRHSSHRVTVERAFGALKNRFKIMYNKPFHPFKTQVKLVLAYCILHNWILRHGHDEHVPSEDSWAPNNNDAASPNDVYPDMHLGLRRGIVGLSRCGRTAGVKKDKGFKEVHLNAVAKQLSEFSGLEVTGTQVYNHLRKWRQRWVKSVDGPKLTDEKVSKVGSSSGKRKRISEEEGGYMTTMTQAVQNVVDALTTPVYNEMPPGLYNAVLSIPGFTDEALMYALQNLLDNKALGLCFMEMSDPHRVLWLRTFLGKHYYI